MTATFLPADTHVGVITLLARDLPKLQAFYTQLLGLQVVSQVISQSADQVVLGAAGTPILQLNAAPELPAPPVSRTGLYHTAFLLPSRAALGEWLAHAARLGLQIGSGDHLVSEAFYLSDPEGNGIEVYADRPRETWTWQGGQVKMDTLAVDAAAVLAAAGISTEQLTAADFPAYAGAPAETSVGHIHLKVGNATQAAQFYKEALGLDIVAQLQGAAFLSWGGYHHHIGLNEWHTRGQPKPNAKAVGLGQVEFVSGDLSALKQHLSGRNGVQIADQVISLSNPWGNQITVREL